MVSVVLTEEWPTKDDDITNNYILSVVLTKESSTEYEILQAITWCV